MNLPYSLKLAAPLVAALLLMPSPALGNGGGYSIDGTKSGSILPFDMEDIAAVAMETENLEIDLGMRGASIRVDYRLRNTRNEPVKVRFGFPMESSPGDKLFGYQVLARGVALPHREVVQADDSVPDQDGWVKVSIMPETIQSWMVSELDFAPNETLTLGIRCDVPHFCTHGSGVFSSCKRMVYRLSSAAVWAGPILKGKITVRAPFMEEDDLRIESPANRFKRKDGAWVWEFSDLEPTLADDIKIDLDGGREEHDVEEAKPRGTYIIQGRKYGQSILAHDISITASATQTGNIPGLEARDITFNVRNLPQDYKHDGKWYVWGVPGRGIGESVTVTLDRPCRLAGFYLCPGVKEGGGEFDRKTAPSFGQYGSVEEMDVVVNGTWKRKVRFEPGAGGSRWVSLHACPEEARTIRFIIRKSSPGSGYNVTCLSDLRLYRKLSKEPKITPLR